MTQAELQEQLDIRMTKVIEELRKEAGMESVTFSGGVTGFMLKTGIAIAIRDGCPRRVLLKTTTGLIENGYG